jgi:hypothetical protein
MGHGGRCRGHARGEAGDVAVLAASRERPSALPVGRVDPPARPGGGGVARVSTGQRLMQTLAAFGWLFLCIASGAIMSVIAVEALGRVLP